MQISGGFFAANSGSKAALVLKLPGLSEADVNLASVVRVRMISACCLCVGIFDRLHIIMQTLRSHVKEYTPDFTQEGGPVSWQS
jgi:hypothetical protein